MADKLVAYFSASGVTAKVAQTMARVLNADLYEIEPFDEYKEADLDWKDPNSRSSIEMKDKTSRPKIRFDIVNMDTYDTIVLGFPIWWYVAPTIVNTFLESYDLTGKKIVLFATSGSSGMGNTLEELKDSAKGAEFIAQKRVSSSITFEEAKEWLDSLDI